MSTDTDLRELRRRYDESGGPWDRYHWRVACVRAGRAEEAGIEVGDRVLVTPDRSQGSGGWPQFSHWDPTEATITGTDFIAGIAAWRTVAANTNRPHLLYKSRPIRLLAPARPDAPVPS
jgi:hypothetical protein